jgi:hypothetical protein
VAVSRGLDRDRVVDETGNQTVVFGRRGSRPFNLVEMQKLLRHADGTPYTVEDVSDADRDVTGRPGPYPPKAEPAGNLALPRPERLMRRGE